MQDYKMQDKHQHEPGDNEGPQLNFHRSWASWRAPNLIVCPLSQRSCQTEPLGLFHLATILLTPSKGKGKYHNLNE